MPDENLRLRAALRDLVALSTIPAGWIGIDRTIATASSQVNDRFWHFADVFLRTAVIRSHAGDSRWPVRTAT
jgi:hypothetical protein